MSGDYLLSFKPCSSYELQVLWMKASKLSKQLEIEIKKTHDERWGEVNIYHKSILEKFNLF